MLIFFFELNFVVTLAVSKKQSFTSADLHNHPFLQLINVVVIQSLDVEVDDDETANCGDQILDVNFLDGFNLHVNVSWDINVLSVLRLDDIVSEANGFICYLL